MIDKKPLCESGTRTSARRIRPLIILLTGIIAITLITIAIKI